MAENTNIEWCDSTFNPWTGCTKVGPGCDHCYAEGWAKRSGLVQWGPGAERRRTSAANWQKPLQWNAERFVECTECGWRGEQRKAHSGGTQCPACSFGRETLKPARRRVFCASLADVFDKEVPVEWRADLFWLIHSTPNLDWLLVTKRIGNAAGMMRAAMLEIDPSGEWPAPWPNVWLGITVVNQAEADRDIPKLLQTPAAVRFLSMEPLLGPVLIDTLLCEYPEDEDEALYPGRLDWVIVGGESGSKARPMHPQWARDIRDQCEEAGVPFLFKQWGEWAPIAADPSRYPICALMYRVGKKAAGRLLDGREHNGFPIQPARGEG